MDLTLRRQGMTEYYVDNLERLLLNTLTSFRDSETTNMPTPYMFQGKTALESLYLPGAIGDIPNYCFDGCTSLQDIDLLGASTIGTYSFRNCSSLNEIDMPDVTSIGNYAFSGCTTLTQTNFPKVTTIGTYAFQNNKSLGSVQFSSTTSFGNYAFNGCSNLASIDAPLISTLGDYTFQNCSKLTNINVPYRVGVGQRTFTGCSSIVYFVHDISGIYTEMFKSCTSLLAVDCGPRLSALRANMLNGATKINTLVIRNYNSVVALDATSAFTNTPFASGKAGGTLYVPADLITSYQDATNWKTILGYANNRIKAIEGSEYEHYFVDGTRVQQPVAQTLTGCTSSNTALYVPDGNAYSTTITTDDGYELTSVAVIMGGVDITSTAYDSLTTTITIANVTGAISIIAMAEVID